MCKEHLFLAYTRTYKSKGQACYLLLQRQASSYLRKEVTGNWCEGLGRFLEDDEISKKRSKKGNFPVKPVKTRQWCIRVEQYAHRLYDGIETLEWSKKEKTRQKELIKKENGILVDFYVVDKNTSFSEWVHNRKLFPEQPKGCIRAFIKEPELIFGSSFVAIPKNHSLIQGLEKQKKEFVEKRISNDNVLKEELFGVFTGLFCVCPCTGKKIPIMAANVKQPIIGIPAHCFWSYKFANKHNIKYIACKRPHEIGPEVEFDMPYTGNGYMVNSFANNGLTNEFARGEVSKYLVNDKIGAIICRYKVPVVHVSNVGYWDCPIPIMHSVDGAGKRGNLKISNTRIPVKLPPENKNYPPYEPVAALNKSDDTWLYKDFGNGTSCIRETLTLSSFFDSFWSFLPLSNDDYCDTFLTACRGINMPVDMLVVDNGHSDLTILYSRFMQKFLYDIGYVKNEEPFRRIVRQGPVKDNNEKLIFSGLSEKYGYDAIRMASMFSGEFMKERSVSEETVSGCHDFLESMYDILTRNVSGGLVLSADLIADVRPGFTDVIEFNDLINKVNNSIANCKPNTALSELMIYLTNITMRSIVPLKVFKKLLCILSLFAPFAAQDLWSLCRSNSENEDVYLQEWPKEFLSTELLKEGHIQISVSLNGKQRFILTVEEGESEKNIVTKALSKISSSGLISFTKNKYYKHILIPNGQLNIIMIDRIKLKRMEKKKNVPIK